MVGCRGARESEGNERARGEGEGEDGRGCGRGRRRQRLRRRREARGSTHKKPTPCTTMLSKKKMVDETARASRSQRRGLSARLAGRTQGRSVEDAGEERLGLQRVDDLSLADILRLDAGLGEHCGGGERQPKREEGVQGVPRLVQAAREEHSELSWSGRRGRRRERTRTALLGREPLADLGTVGKDEPRDDGEPHRDNALYEEDIAPCAVRSNRVDLENGAGEKAADGAGERGADDVAGEAEAELVLAVCTIRSREQRSGGGRAKDAGGGREEEEGK